MVLDDMALHIQTAGFGVVASNLFKGSHPDGIAYDGLLVALVEPPGRSPEHTLDAANSPPVDRPTLQIWTRGEPEDYATPRQLIQDIHDLLDGTCGKVIGTGYYESIRALQPPYKIDESEFRFVFVFNTIYRVRRV